jgi:hypothetical protein
MDFMRAASGGRGGARLNLQRMLGLQNRSMLDTLEFGAGRSVSGLEVYLTINISGILLEETARRLRQCRPALHETKTRIAIRGGAFIGASYAVEQSSFRGGWRRPIQENRHIDRHGIPRDWGNPVSSEIRAAV